MGEVVPVLVVVFFWTLAFVFAFWFTNRALRAPVDAEHMDEAAEIEEADEVEGQRDANAGETAVGGHTPANTPH